MEKIPSVKLQKENIYSFWRDNQAVKKLEENFEGSTEVDNLHSLPTSSQEKHVIHQLSPITTFSSQELEFPQREELYGPSKAFLQEQIIDCSPDILSLSQLMRQPLTQRFNPPQRPYHMLPAIRHLIQIAEANTI